MSLTPQSDFPVGCNRIAGCSFPSINGYPGTILHPPPPPPDRLYKFGTPPRRRTSLSRAIYHYTVYSRRSRVRRRPQHPPSPAQILPGAAARRFPPSPGTRRTRTKREKRFLVTCYFIRLGKETHTRGGARVQIDLSRRVTVHLRRGEGEGRVDVFLSRRF